MEAVVLLNEFLPECVGEEVNLPVARTELWKRRWRGVAEDGTAVSVDLSDPCKDGDLLGGGGCKFRICQLAEEVVAIPMPAEAEMAAKIGWYLGNRHIPIEVRDTELVMENFPTLTDSLERIGIAFEIRDDVLRCKAGSGGHRH